MAGKKSVAAPNFVKYFERVLPHDRIEAWRPERLHPQPETQPET